jgi:hypothetical protein
MADRKTSKRSKAKTILRLADLEQSKNAVLHSLGAASSQESKHGKQYSTLPSALHLELRQRVPHLYSSLR